jgi:tetratricopeptide (TPR) repeat protein
MNTTSRNVLLGLLALVAIGAVGYAVVSSKGTTATSTDSGIVFDPNATTSQTIETPNGSYTITPVTDDAPTPPNYKKAVAFKGEVSTEVRDAINAQLKETQDVIAGDQYNFEAWVNLGILHKIGGDYEGAAEIWRYVAAIYPNSTVPLDNLGGLYMDFLKNYARAETNFKASIALDSHDINAYQQLVSLYTVYGYKGTSTAVALIEQGLAANPGNASLTQLKAELSQ